MKKIVFVIFAALCFTGFLHADSLNVRTVGIYDISDIPALVDVEGSNAYVSYLTTALRILDVSDPATPTELGSFETPDFREPGGLHVVDSYAYLTFGPYADSSWLVIVDASTPSAPTEEALYEPGMRGHDVFVQGDYAYIAECLSLQILDVSTPSAPVEMGNCELSLLCHAQAVYVAGDYAYLTGTHAMHIVDITSPGQPYEVGRYDTLEYSWDVFVDGDYAYVAAQYDGVQIIDVSDPENPVLAGAYDTPGDAQAVDVHDTLAYVADNFGGLRVLNVADPTNPVEVGFYETENVAGDICYKDGYIYVVCASAGLYIFEFDVFPVEVEETVTEFKVKAYLNSLSYEIGESAELTLYSADGRKVTSETISGKGFWEVPLNVPQGVYFARINTQTQTREVRLIVIR